MKLYNILNENHPKGWVLFKKDKTVKHKVIINDGEYIIENEYGTKVLSRELEKMLLEEIEIIENKEDLFDKFIKNTLLIKHDLSESSMRIKCCQDTYEIALDRSENIDINIKNTYGEASFMMDFSEFDKIVKYVNNLRKLLDK